MKTYTIVLGIAFLFVSCGEAPKKDTAQQGEKKSTEKNNYVTESLPSADYSSLLIDYSCDMSITEVAKALEVSETDLSIPEYSKKPYYPKSTCYFSLKGFGTGPDGDSPFRMHTAKMTKAEVKKEIKGYLKRKNDGLEDITKTYVVEADTKDCYIATQLRYGRVIILNENYDNAFVIQYGTANKIVDNDDHKLVKQNAAGTENPNTDRTTEQHKELTKKVVKLANYLLQKHRK